MEIRVEVSVENAILLFDCIGQHNRDKKKSLIIPEVENEAASDRFNQLCQIRI